MVPTYSYRQFPKRLWAWLLVVTLWESAIAQGFLLTYPQQNAEYGFSSISRLSDGHALLHGTSGPWGDHTRNMRVDGHGNPVWIFDYRHLTVEYTRGRVSIGDSLFFDAGITSANQQVMSDPFLMCYDAQGQLRWFRQYKGARYDQFIALTMTPNGDFWGIGRWNDSLQIGRAFVMRLNHLGDSLWARDHTAVNYDEFFGTGIIALPNGEVLYSISLLDKPDGYHLYRVDSLGNVLSDRAYLDHWHNNPFHHLELSRDGNILCRSDWTETFSAYTPDGDLLHSFQVDGEISGATELMDGGFLLVGGAPSGDFFLQKLNPDWTVAWRRDYDLPDNNYINKALELPSRELLLAGGRFTNVLGSGEGLLLRTDCEGNLTDYTHCLPPGPEYALWPNPSDGHATLSIPSTLAAQPHEVQVWNALGQRLYQQRHSPTEFVELDLSGLSPGVYFLRVLRAGEAVWQRPWMIRR